MNPTATPAYRLTASSILSSFRSSGKRHLVLTGSIGSGKTTLLRELFPAPLPGITTWAEPGKAVYLKDNSAGDFVQIAAYDGSIPGANRKMALLGDDLSTFGVAAAEHCLQSDSHWVSIDEIGFLEESCEPYKAAVRELFDRKRVAAVIRKEDLPFLKELRQRSDVFVADLDLPFRSAGCVIMASGLGRRFGGNKLMADFLGVPLITRILDATEQLFAKRVVVTRHRSVADLCHGRKIPVVLHDLPYRSDTVRLGLEALGDAERVMFCPGDQPLLSQETLASLLLCSANDADAIWRPCHEDTAGSPVLFPAWAFAELRELPQGKGGSRVIGAHPKKCRRLPLSDPWELLDADTPETLDALRQRAEKR